MEGFLRADNTATIFPGSPTNSFLADEVASICPLITPSPPTNDLINPLPEPAEPIYAIGEELATKLQQVQDESDGKGGGDSASSSSSAIAEPIACTQLLNHRNVYHQYTKDEETVAQETTGKTQTLQLTFRNPPDNYFFMSWNWPLIRKISMWTYLAGLSAMLALVIAMVYSMPKTCNPPTQWYQGSVFYEIFPASYYDADQNMVGDFKGISGHIEYFKKLGIRGIRLNSIFETPNYPEDYTNVTTLFKIAPQLGSIQSFESMVKHFKSENISIILDIPVYPVLKQLTSKKKVENDTGLEPSAEFLKADPIDGIEEALLYWINKGVDGFYLKGLEYFVDDPNFADSIRQWKKILGPDRIIIVSKKVVDNIPKPIINILYNNVNLIDVRLQIEKGVTEVTKQIENLLNGTLFSKAGMPWIQWTLGDESTVRLANRLHHANGTLGATLLQLMLPGTPCLFYGDEIGLQQIVDPKGERKDVEHLHHLGAMVWPAKSQETLPWLHGDRFDPDFDQVDVIANMTRLRASSPSVYVNSVNKAGDNKANAEVKYSRQDLLVIQRWYPRRKAYVVVSNFGDKQLEADLSTLLYSGSIKVGPRPGSKPGSVTFKQIFLWPGESVVIELD